MTWEEWEEVEMLVKGLADQQAMQDDWWKERLQLIYNQYVEIEES